MDVVFATVPTSWVTSHVDEPFPELYGKVCVSLLFILSFICSLFIHIHVCVAVLVRCVLTKNEGKSKGVH